MSEYEIEALVTKLVDDLFNLGGKINERCQRIQLMGGEYPYNEKNLGGMNRTAMTMHYRDIITEFFKG